MKKVLLLIVALFAFVNIQAQNVGDIDGWYKYEIAKRTSSNPLVNKSYLKGKLTQHQRDLVLSTPYVDTSLKIYDAAHLLTDKEYSDLQKRAKLFVEVNDIDLAIVTINHNNKVDTDDNNASENFALDFYKYNDFGRGEQSQNGYNGVILLIDMQYRKICIFEFGALDTKYEVAKLHRDKYIGDVAPFLTLVRYFEAISTFINEYECGFHTAKMIYD